MGSNPVEALAGSRFLRFAHPDSGFDRPTPGWATALFPSMAIVLVALVKEVERFENLRHRF